MRKKSFFLLFAAIFKKECFWNSIYAVNSEILPTSYSNPKSSRKRTLLLDGTGSAPHRLENKASETGIQATVSKFQARIG